VATYAVYRRNLFPLSARVPTNSLIDLPENEVRDELQRFAWNWSAIGTTLQAVETGIRSNEMGASGSTSFDATNLTTPADSSGLLGDLTYGNIEMPDHYPGARSAEGSVTAELVYVVSDQAGNRASCSREVVVVDLEDPVVDCANVLPANYEPKVLYDGRTCIGDSSTSNPQQICTPRALTDVDRDPADTVENEHIVDAISWNLPTRTDNTDGYIVPTDVANVVMQTLNAGGNGDGSIANGAYATSAYPATYGGYVPHFFGVQGLDRHPLRNRPVITLRTPASFSENVFDVHFDVFDRSGNRAECSIARDDEPIQIEVRCSPILNWQYITDGVTPGPENEAHPCECCRNGIWQSSATCSTDLTTVCASGIYAQSTGCGGGWPETVAGGVGMTMCSEDPPTPPPPSHVCFRASTIRKD
jgi:hypothetical protein